MSPPGPGIEDRDLHAWVDGRLDPEARARVGERISADSALVAQATHLQQQNAALRAMLVPELEAPVPERLLAAARGEPAANRPLFRQASGFALALLLGVAGGWTVRDRLGGGAARVASPAPSVDPEGLTRAAAVAHAAYAPEVRHPVEVAASEQAHLVAWLSKRLGTTLKVPDLAPQGWSLVGGRLLPDPTGGVAAQFMFDNDAGQRLTLFVRRTPAGADTAFRYARQDGIGSFYWIDRGFGYALSGELPRDAMLSIATAVHRQINP